jgi:hypothetical protein
MKAERLKAAVLVLCRWRPTQHVKQALLATARLLAGALTGKRLIE